LPSSEDGGSGPAVVCGYVVGGWCVPDLGGNRKLNGIALGTYRDISLTHLEYSCYGLIAMAEMTLH
jgi:hypothetical protein